MIGGRSAETIRVDRDRIDDCRQPVSPLQLSLAQAGLSIDVSGLWCGALRLRARMGIRAHPTLTKRTTSKGQAGTQSCGYAGQSVRPSPHSISQTSVGKLLNRSIFDVSLSLSRRGSGEAIASEPSSLACPIQRDWRARVAEREGVHSLGESERTNLMRHWGCSLARSRDRGRARPRRCARACWRVRSRAGCDAPSALRPGGSRAIRRA